MKRLSIFLLTVFVFSASACSGLPPLSPAEQPTAIEFVTETQDPATFEPTSTAVPTETPVPTPLFEAITYRDEAAGFAFDYPDGWTLDGGESQPRGSYVQFYSWDWQPGEPIDPMPVGGTVLTVTNQLWDPKNDLEAFINQRKMAWDASGISILSEDRLTLADGRPAAQFIVQGIDGAQAFFLLTTNGENYLILSGSGDLELLAAIAHTLRPIQ